MWACWGLLGIRSAESSNLFRLWISDLKRMVFCHDCGFNCESAYRFCPQCGTATINASSATPESAQQSFKPFSAGPLSQQTYPSPLASGSSLQPISTNSSAPLSQQKYPGLLPSADVPCDGRGQPTLTPGLPQQAISTNPPASAFTFFDARGEPTPVFTKYASAVLDALDATIDPKGTGWFEYPKLVHLDKIGSLGTSALQGRAQETLLRMFQSFNCQARLVPVVAYGGKTSHQVALTRDGAMAWLRFAVLRDPIGQLLHWERIVPALRLNLPPVQSSMLPAAPNKEINALVQAFEAGCEAQAAAIEAEKWKKMQDKAKSVGKTAITDIITFLGS